MLFTGPRGRGKESTVEVSRCLLIIPCPCPSRSRIVYSREQLLSLASSPLSQTPPHIPAEISRSPEKSSLLGQAATSRSNGTGSAGKLASGVTNQSAPLARAPNGHAAPSEVFGSSYSNGTNHSVNGNGRAAIPRSPPAASTRSPGNAFNFSNGPVSPNGMSHSTSFKERMAAAAAQQQSHQERAQLQGRATQGRSDDALLSSSSRGAGEEGHGANGANGDEQFSMDM